MTAYFKQKILKACRNHAEAPATPSDVWVWAPAPYTWASRLPHCLFLLQEYWFWLYFTFICQQVTLSSCQCYHRHILIALLTQSLSLSLWAWNKCQLLFHAFLPREGGTVSTHKAKTPPWWSGRAQGCRRVKLPSRSVLGPGWLLWILAKCSWAIAPSLLVNQHHTLTGKVLK